MGINSRYLNSMFDLARRLPPEVVYACGVTIFAHGTTGKYGQTECTTVSAVELINRYREDRVAPLEVLVKKKDIKG